MPTERTARATVPVFQKYDTSDCVNAFIKDPQHCLTFVEEDFVQYLERLPDLPALAAPFVGRKRRLSDMHLVTTQIRKIFLDTHRRFYLVVCELHCDAPGMPSVNRQDVCQAGFAVRRLRTIFDKAGERAAVKHLRGISAAIVNMSIAENFASKPARDARHRGAGSESAMVTTALSAAANPAQAQASTHLVSARRRLLQWAELYGARVAVEGWMPTQHEHVGSWQDTTNPVDVVAETVYPLYPLVPDPRALKHAGQGRTIYFGLVTTGGADVDAFGNPRFDDQNLYEVRCFVRRHDPRCPKQAGTQDCHGPLTWSGPTEQYRIAAHFDLKGTSNRPVTIQLPDVPSLQAQAAALKPGEGTPVKMVSPAGSAFQFPQNGQIPGSGSMNASPEVCSFSIPLITIVATFVFNLFLPIVVLVFGLWFLLKLKFCLPPSADVQSQLTAELALLPPGVDLSVDVDVKADASTNYYLQNRLTSDLNVRLGAPAGNRLTSTYTNNVLLHMQQDTVTASLAPASFTGEVAFEVEEDPQLAVIR